MRSRCVSLDTDTWRCGYCSTKCTQLRRVYRTWPTAEFAALAEDSQPSTAAARERLDRLVSATRSLSNPLLWRFGSLRWWVCIGRPNCFLQAGVSDVCRRGGEPRGRVPGRARAGRLLGRSGHLEAGVSLGNRGSTLKLGHADICSTLATWSHVPPQRPAQTPPPLQSGQQKINPKTRSQRLARSPALSSMPTHAA